MEYEILDVFDKSYVYCDQIQYRDHERAAYESLCGEVFPGLSFEKWYRAGYWDKNLFNPHVLMDGDKVVSAVSVNKMFIRAGNNEQQLYIQLGGVMTAPSYRNQGLAMALLDRILTDWVDRCEGIFLFANDSVLDFYPKFGFKAVDEHQYRMKIEADENAEKAINLNMDNKEDVDCLLRLYKKGNPFSRVNINNSGLLMFYCMKYNRNDVYYVESEDGIAVVGYEGNDMVVYDIFCESGRNLKNILGAVAREDTRTVYFGFPLNKEKGCKLDLYEEEDNTLFILDKRGSNSLADFLRMPQMKGKLMFPLLGHS